MATEKLEEVERHHGKSANGIRKGSSLQAISSVDLICDDDSKASDNISEKEPQTHFIPIRRNSRFYRSIRLRNREKVKSNKKAETECVEGSLRNGNIKDEFLSKDELLRVFHKSLSLHVKPNMTASQEQWFQRGGEYICKLVNLKMQIVKNMRGVITKCDGCVFM